VRKIKHKETNFGSNFPPTATTASTRLYGVKIGFKGVLLWIEAVSLPEILRRLFLRMQHISFALVDAAPSALAPVPCEA
jgi:hypothetical protein